MAAGGAGADSAREGLERARGGAEEVEGKAKWLGARRIERGWRGLAGAASGGALHDSAQLFVSSGKEGKTETAPGEDKLELERCRGAMADA